MFKKISQKIERINNKNEFGRFLVEVCSDGKITDEELQQINELAQQLNIEKEDLDKVSKKAYNTAFKQILSDGIISEEEHNNIVEIQEVLLLDNSDIQKYIPILQKHQLLRDMQNGILHEIPANGLLKKKNEKVYLSINVSLLEERVVSRRYQGGSAGMNIRVAKGVSFRVGQHKGRLVSEKDTVVVDQGDFYITNQRFIYKGQKKNFNITLKQLLGYQVYKNGIDINGNRGATKQLNFISKVDTDVVELLIQQVIEQNEV